MMIKATARSTKALLTSRFRYAGRRLFFARARLFQDCIELTGLDGMRRHRRVIAVEDIEEVKWRPSGEASYNVTLVLASGEHLVLWLDGPGLWKYAIEQARGHIAGVRNGVLPEEMTAASAA